MVKQLKLDRIPIIKHWDSALELLDKDRRFCSIYKPAINDQLLAGFCQSKAIYNVLCS